MSEIVKVLMNKQIVFSDLLKKIIGSEVSTIIGSIYSFNKQI